MDSTTNEDSILIRNDCVFGIGSNSRPGCSWPDDPLHPALPVGRTWWAHFEFTRINIELTILSKKIEDSR